MFLIYIFFVGELFIVLLSFVIPLIYQNLGMFFNF